MSEKKQIFLREGFPKEELDWKQRDRNGSWSVKLEDEVRGLGEFQVVRCLANREGWGLEVMGEDRLPPLAPVTSRSGLLSVHCGGSAMQYGFKLKLPLKKIPHTGDTKSLDRCGS